MTADPHTLVGPYVVDALPPRSTSSRSTCAGAPSARPRWTACGPRLRLGRAAATEPAADLRSRVLADVARTRQVPPRRSAVRPHRHRWPMLLAAAAVPRSSPPSAAWPSGRTTGPIRPSSSPRSCRTPPPRPSRCPARRGPCASSCPRRTTARCCSRTACPPPSGKDYELWYRVDGEMVPVGVFAPDDDGTVRQRLERAPRTSSASPWSPRAARRADPADDRRGSEGSAWLQTPGRAFRFVQRPRVARRTRSFTAVGVNRSVTASATASYPTR